MIDEPNALQNVPGDGAPQVVGEDELSQLKNDVQLVANQSSIFQTNRMADGNTRFAIWDGQSDDGRKHAEDLGRDAWPYEGAPDSRQRLCDMAVRKKTSQLVVAALRSQVSFQAEGQADPLFAQKMQAIYDWTLRQWSTSYMNEVQKAANWFMDGTPAGALFFVHWKQTKSLRMKTVNADEAAQWILDTYFENPTPDDLLLMQQYLTDPNNESAAVDTLALALPGQIDRSTIRDMVKSLRETGTAEFPEPYEYCNEPLLESREPFGDTFWPVNTVKDIQYARVVYDRVWLTAAQVHEYALQYNWSPDFVNKLIGKPEEQNATTGGGFAGQSMLPLPNGTVQQAQTPMGQQMGIYKDFRHLYEVIVAYTRGVNKYGIPGIYVTYFSGFVDEAAAPKQLFASGHGKMPFVWAQRELVNHSTTDSRGLSFIGTADQNLLKMYTDLSGAGAQLSALPPMEDDIGVPDGDFHMTPLAVNKRSRPGTIRPIQIPRSDSNAEAQAMLERRFKEYWGLAWEGVDANEATVLTQLDIERFLGALREALMMCMQNAQEFLRPEQVEEICGPVLASVRGDEPEMADTVQEDRYADVSGRFHMSISFDAIDLDPERLMQLTDVVLDKLLPVDTDQTIQRAQAVRMILNKWSPSMAKTVAIPKETADTREIAAMDADLSKMLTGVSVPMQEKGINHRLRLERLQQRLQLPNIQARLQLEPDAAALVEQYAAFLQQQVTQQQNVVTGKLGVAPDAMQQQAG